MEPILPTRGDAIIVSVLDSIKNRNDLNNLFTILIKMLNTRLILMPLAVQDIEQLIQNWLSSRPLVQLGT